MEERFFRETWAEINLDAISENIVNLKKHLSESTAIFAVVKANAYGHGDVQVAKAALAAGADYLAVAFLDEALSLRADGIHAPILVLGATPVRHVVVAAKQDIILTVFEKDWLNSAAELLTVQKLSLKIHVKCDTGMGRLGVRSTKELIELVKELDKTVFDFDGIFTHFATADDLDETYFHKQLALFQEMIAGLAEKPRLVHCSNSAATLRYPNAFFNAVRFGISLYGATPSIDMIDLLPFQLQPAMSLHTTVIQVKKITAGDKLSYGATYQANDDQWIATLPLGYADGWLRKLSGQAVLVNGERCEIVGRICMDQCMIRLPKEFPVGTKVTLIGENTGKQITVDEVAQYLQTINYEVFCGIAARVPRVYLSDGKVVAIRNSLL